MESPALVRVEHAAPDTSSREFEQGGIIGFTGDGEAPEVRI